jgi:uncharacterized protein (DUF362 family)/ferredoxin
LNLTGGQQEARRTAVLRLERGRDIRRKIGEELDNRSGLIPPARDARILIKPNLNNFMNALTGNTTDLRLIAAVVSYFKDRGYTDITIGDGTNSGYYRHNISVIDFLMLRRLADHFGVKVLDFNRAESTEVAFRPDFKADVARRCLEADLFINMPKLKTHFEAGMTVCLKNLIGCLKGQENKKKVHRSLARNIVGLNEKIRPHLHIVDGLIAMEGLGPSRGTPLRLDTVIFGNDPFAVDLLCARIAGIDVKDISPLKAAGEAGYLDGGLTAHVDAVPIDDLKRPFFLDRGNFLVRLIHGARRQKYFLAIRRLGPFNYLCATRLGGKLLFSTGLRQDVFLSEEVDYRGLHVDPDRCVRCGKCSDYCPVEIDLPDGFACLDEKGCIHCLYCYFVCEQKAVIFEGEFGFLREQIRAFDTVTRSTT